MIMDEREILLRRVAIKCKDFARQLSYHRAFKKYANSLKQSTYFWKTVYNNAIDLAVLDWFHLFGYHNDDLHWKNTVGNIEKFRNELFCHLSLSRDEFNEYWVKIKEYRDKDIAHIEVRPVSNVPEMTAALKAVGFYYEFTLKELSSYGDYSMEPKDLIQYHIKSLEQAERIVSPAYEATKSIFEKVF